MPDFRISDQGTVVCFTPLTDAAQQWVDDNVQAEPWQWLGPVLVVDHRMAQALAEGIAAEFEIEID